jgi:hypothetical protein
MAVYRQSARLAAKPLETRDKSFLSTEHLRLQSLCNILSGERMGLSFTIAADPRQLSHSRVQVPRDSWPILLSQTRDFPNLKGQVPVFIFPQNMVAQLYPRHWLFFSPPPTICRATVEAFEPASTRSRQHNHSWFRFIFLKRTEKRYNWIQARIHLTSTIIDFLDNINCPLF